ncbi:MAG: NAD-glutamate dehydrogenase [Alphaproteobacteria bacterium]|nr:NAD-glutamate dehydrogenase [Alphaproteobacteria bacterium]
MAEQDWAGTVGKQLTRRFGKEAGPLAPAYLSSLAQADRTTPDREAMLAAHLFELARKLPKVGRVIRICADPSAPSRIEIIHPDRPFLLASVGMALAAWGCEVARVAHPVLRVRRDGRGQLKSLGDEAGSSESWMQFVLKDPLDETQCADLHARIAEILQSVDAVVGDWFAMRQKVFAAAARQSDSESKTFLEWIEDGHFTLLGAGRFALKNGRLVPAGKGLGLLTKGAHHQFDAKALAAGVKAPGLFVTKADRRSPVHRPVLMDLIGVPAGEGRIDLFLGLMTADVYSASVASLPWARRKAEAVLKHFGFDPLSHNGRLLANILETLPRDALFQSEGIDLVHLARGILELQNRSRVALFLLPDAFKRSVTALVYVPREVYDTHLRLTLQTLIEAAAGGSVISSAVLVNEQPLARLHLVVTHPGVLPPIDGRALEERLARAARGWSEELGEALVSVLGEAEGRRRAARYAKSFPAAYREATPPASALADIGRAEALLAGADIVAALEEHSDRLLFKLARAEKMIPLSLVLPRLENLGFTGLSEHPFRLSISNGLPIWLHVFEVESTGSFSKELSAHVVEAFLAVWRGEAEDDSFNRLVVRAGLSWREAALLRALARYLIQAGSPVSLAYMSRVLESHPQATALLVALFKAQHDPALKKAETGPLEKRLSAYLDTVINADEDRILKRFLNLIGATLRTSYFTPSPVMSFKFKSTDIEGLPDPKPWAEIWVHGPRVEGIHLRGGPVARGGIRWSDRPEDFRTEILGLMKAQTVKNTVIVPVGAKGGFVVRKPPIQGGREAFLAEGIACYKLFIAALLDLTDNLVRGRIVPPKGLVRRDGDDPYLVVAADKGTASFSDIANALSLERSFWLGDAFASGGSKGYDHKGMGITAKGAWISVRRHFRELGIDPEKEVIRAVGVGDMSGDVFGNGLLRSKTVKLVGAFDHRHIFIDPDPDPKKSFQERQRLFNLPRSSWADYDSRLISKGGGVIDRQAKSVKLSSEAQALLGVKAASPAPSDIIKALLKLPVDLIWFGGIGTYVKARSQSNADAGDRASDSVRVDAEDLRARVIGEGANLGVTQAGRVAFALAGGRINTDAIDNSAGVDTSDHEVNIKILLDGLVASGRIRPGERDRLLVGMTHDVAELVLRDNRLQTLSLSLSEAMGPELLDSQARLIRHLEKLGRLNRKLAGLPGDEDIAERQAEGKGLTRPEMAELLAHGKIWMKDEVLASTLPDNRALEAELLGCFPPVLSRRFADAIFKHPLKREILATHVVNSLINRLGPTFAVQMMERTGASALDAATAYLVVRDGFDMRGLWDEVMGNESIPAQAQYAMLAETNRLVERVASGLLRTGTALDLGASLKRLGSVAEALKPQLAGLLDEEARKPVEERVQGFIAKGAPEALARRVANLILMAAVSDVAAAAEIAKRKPEAVAKAYFAVGARFSLGIFRRVAESLTGGSHWQRLARYAVIEELHQCQRDLAVAALRSGGLAQWLKANPVSVARIDQLVTELKALGEPELAALAILARQLRSALS